MNCDRVCFIFFFFQAEDGIRDDLVTGVQTCALPISKLFAAIDEALREFNALKESEGWESPATLDAFDQIGRASCRERV